LRCICIGATLAVAGVSRPVAAQKTDTLRLKNGDRLVGEVKGLTHALLRYSTDNLSTVSIEWDAVASLVSRSAFEVELQSGHKHYGRLATAPAGYLTVAGPIVADTLPLGLVVHIVPMSQRFWSRVDGYVDVGFTYQQANHNLQLTLGSEASYRGPNLKATIQGSHFVQDQDSLEQISRSSLTLMEQAFLRNRWIAVLSQGYERNEELELIGRTKFGAGVGRYMVQSDEMEFTLGAGAVVLHERYLGQAEGSTTVEGQVSAQFDAFRYNSPKLDLSTSLMIYPGITDWGRVRIDFDTRVSYELIKDFFLTLSLFERYDSRPPSETAAKSDFGTTLSISWSF
jgi:hypothetical protein